MLEVYQSHPLSLATLLARVGTNRPLSEDDLAVDPLGEVTDQNHIGGAAFALKLAKLAGVTRGDRVLDLGCGIGGPARLLASRFGCEVHGVDANVGRVEDARALSALTNLSGLTSFEAVDFMAATFPCKYDVVWGENSWIHVADREALASIASAALRPAGRIAFEDVCIKRSLSNATERRLFDEISDAWRSTIVPQSSWTTAFERAGCKTTVVEEDSGPYVAHYARFTELARKTPDLYPPHERLGWECARSLGESGAFGFYRIVATKP
jgi:cyclopropane fatty-acyl-phospholipid synthase-like methyltransferase